jgi:sodium/proline symporter
MDQVYLIAFASYIGVLGLITAFFYKKSSSSQDFVLGNRSLNYAAAAIAAHSSDMSIWLFMGFPGMVYRFGIQKVWIPIGLIIGMYCSWTFVAKKLRIATAQFNSVTLSEYFEHRFDDKSGLLRAVSAILALLFFLFYISSGLVGMGVMFESVFGLNYHVGVLCGLLTAVIYTLIGGFVGVAWCDLFQGLFLVTMIVLVPIVGYSMLGNGYSQIADVAQLKNISLSLFESPKELISGLLLALGWGLGYFGQPHILVNFMGIKDANSINKAKYVGMTWQFFTLAASVAVGLVGIGLFAHSLANPELVFVTMVQNSFTPFFAGFVLCSIIAAGLTTVDTQILVSASIFSEDIYKRYFNPQATPKQTLLVSRIGVVIVPLISYMIAFSKSATVFGLVDFAWNGLGSTFGPVILTLLYSTRVTRNGVLLGMIAGGTIAALWPLAGSTVPAMIPGFFTNLGIIFVMSR